MASPQYESPAPMMAPTAVMDGENGSADGERPQVRRPATPDQPQPTKTPALTPRIKKRVPWNGKNIMVLLPRDDQRGQRGQRPMPLKEYEVANMFRDWEELGYNIRGFDLNEPTAYYALPSEHYSKSRDEWPDAEDLMKERLARKFNVVLPDIDGKSIYWCGTQLATVMLTDHNAAWRRYVDELNEAKLRALGVSFGGDDPPPPPASISPNIQGLSRRATITQYPPLPFSPPIPTSSAASQGPAQQYPFPQQGGPTSINAASSPGPFNAGFNPHQSVSMPPNQSPFGFMPPQPLPSPRDMLLHQSMHRVSPSLSTSPFSPGGFQSPMLHQRHQSLQFPQLPHQQFMPPSRASPRLQELREEEEEEQQSKSPSKTPEPGSYIRHNASESLQKEIDEAEYHLEEQFRSQFEHDQDYSPHNVDEKIHATQPPQEKPVRFGPQAPHFEGGIDKNLVLHHPRPHSRGHSLSQKYFGEEDARGNSGMGGFSSLNTIQDDKAGEELETNPSNLGTPVHGNFSNSLTAHDRTFSNPWQDVQSTSRRPSVSHESRPSSSSKFNVAAPEFKFNPASSFQPGQFNFGSNTFQPAIFQAGVPQVQPDAPTSHQFKPAVPSSGKINANAPVFSPGSSEFSFSAAGAPSFRADAPTFVPSHNFSSVSGSVTSPVLSGSESGKMPSIFGNIDLNIQDVVKPAKKSKAIPIIRPASVEKDNQEEKPAVTEDEHGRIVDDSRVKRARGFGADHDEEVRFADPTEPIAATRDTPAERGMEDELPGRETGLSSTIQSESTDVKDTTSLSEVSADQNTMNWAPADLNSQDEVSAFNAARPFGEDAFIPHHKKSLSATAKPFIPGGSFVPNEDEDKENTPVPAHFGGARSEELEEGEVSSIEEDAVENIQQSIETEPSLVASPDYVQDFSFGEPSFAPSPSPINKGLAGSRFAHSPSASPAKGLAASKYARSPSPTSDAYGQEDAQEALASSAMVEDLEDTQGTISQPSSPPPMPDDGAAGDREPTFEEIDAVMQHINEHDPSLGVKKNIDSSIWRQPSPAQPIPIPGARDSPRPTFPPRLRETVPSPSPRHYHLPLNVRPPLLANGSPMRSTELEDPFVDPPMSTQMSRLHSSDSQAGSEDWEKAFSDEEHDKLESRAQFFDGRVNDLVDGVLEARLGSLERTLGGIQKALSTLSGHPAQSRRERRSASAEVQESDADDEDDEPLPRRSMSPRRDKRMEQIRAAVLEAFSAQQRHAAPMPPPTALDATSQEAMALVLNAMDEMKQQFNQSLHLDFRAEDLRNVVEEAVEKRIPASLSSPPVIEDHAELLERLDEMQARNMELEQRLRMEEAKSSTEFAARRIADDRAAEFERQLHMAETKIEVEIINRSAYDNRVNDLEERLHHSAETIESELALRRAAEDRLSEVQRLLRISSEEEIRLRESLEDKEERISILDASHSKNALRVAMLEVSVENMLKEKSDIEARTNIAEVDARDARQEANRWRLEAERAIELSERQSDDLHRALNEKKQLHALIDTLGTQLNENERVRESWRIKFMSLQEDMARAAQEIAEENAQRAKREQAMLARQEVLDAKLQAESKTRERLETELERLEAGERQGMKAVNEAKRLDALLGEMRTENHKLQQSAMRYQAEFEEARESAAREVQRTRESMQAQIEGANYQVNAIRQEYEDTMSRLHAQLDQAKLDADTVRSRYDMLIEDARANNKGDVDELARKHQDEMEDMQARLERQLNNTIEDAQRNESNLLERLSISTSKCDVLQDRVRHLEEKLEIAREAARAAAQAAKASGVALPPAATVVSPQVAPPLAAQPQAPSSALTNAMQLPEKISPQALRESIMVLQEQLQEREQKIEGLEQTVAKLDPEADTKIAKRDDEITWLRELLAVRHSDLQDIITALGRNDYDQERVRDAAIRLKANLQMEQQERERAMNGGSAINLPNIAASLRDATPRVAQAVGPLAAALGNWRKGGSFTNPLSAPQTTHNNATPRKESPASQSSFLTGLLTPPASSVRQPSPAGQQPTAFSSTGRRFTPQDLANRPKPQSSRQAQKMPARTSESPIRMPNNMSDNSPQTPPMMRSAAYDDDALAEDFDDAGFFDDE